MPTSGFLVLNPNFQGGETGISPLRKPMRSLTILCQVSQTRPAHLMNRRNVF